MTQKQIDRRKFLSVGAVGLAASAVGMRAVLAQGEGTPAATPGATPGASPAASPAVAGEVVTGEFTVEMVDIDFNPNEFTIAANTDVTVHCPNEGVLVHNFNITGKNNPSDPDIHTGDVQPGNVSTVTLNLPAGDWYYYCNIPGHEEAGMYGTVHVVEAG